MVNKYSKQHVIHTFTVGDYATLRMPWIDLASTVLQRLACVVDIFGNTQCMYCLRCSAGVIQRNYHAGDLALFTEDFSIPVEGWVNEARVTLWDAAKKKAPWNVFTANKGSFRGDSCNNLWCHCMKNKIECSTHCHGGKRCSNKQTKVRNMWKSML